MKLVKTVMWLIVLAIIIVGGVYALGLFNPQDVTGIFTPKDAYMENFVNTQKNFESRAPPLATYSDSATGYSLKYPVGYNIGSDAQLDPNVSVRIWADSPYSTPTNPFSGEMISVRIINQDFSDNEYQQALADLSSGDAQAEIVDNHVGVLNGRKTYLFSARQYVDVTDEFFIVRNAVYTGCIAKNGARYSALLTAAIPENLAEDTDLADYMIYSFKC